MSGKPQRKQRLIPSYSQKLIGKVLDRARQDLIDKYMAQGDKMMEAAKKADSTLEARLKRVFTEDQ